MQGEGQGPRTVGDANRDRPKRRASGPSAGETSEDVEEAARKPLRACGSPEPASLKEKGLKGPPRGGRNSPGEDLELQLRT